MNNKNRAGAAPAAAGNTSAPAVHRPLLIQRKPAVLAQLGVSDTTLRRWMADDGFPRRANSGRGRSDGSHPRSRPGCMRGRPPARMAQEPDRWR